MVELTPRGLTFSFPEVHPQANLRIAFQRTLRIPDTGETYPLPPGLGQFPMRHVDDFANRVPPRWAEHGGVMLPMYQSEALWINFDSDHVPGRGTRYPFAVKIAAGKIDAVTGQSWSNEIHRNPQDYVVVPGQPWLDGFAVEKGVVRQFVAMPLGAGYTAEEQMTGKAEHGGLQILVRPMRRAAFEARFPKRVLRDGFETFYQSDLVMCAEMDMGLAPGGRMKQDIYRDTFRLDEWDHDRRGRAFVHLVNSLMWEAVTGDAPPSPPPTAKVYSEHGLPWFDYYDESREALGGSDALHRLRSVIEMARAKGEPALPENDAATPRHVRGVRS